MNRIIILLLFLAIAAAGCKSAPKREASTVAALKAVSDPRVVVEPALTNWLRIVRVDGSTAGRFMRVEIDVQNTSRVLQRFTYRVDWMDAKGNEIPDVSTAGVPWTLLAGEASALMITAPTPVAKDFKAEFFPAPIR